MTTDKDARIAELEAENERLRRLVMAQSRAIHSPEALSRTVAVKVLEAELGWYSRTEHGALDGIPYKHVAHVIRVMLSRLSALEPAATCNESLQVEPAAPEGQQQVTDALELSGNTGELIDRMAAAIRDWGSHYDDGPWETLPEDRKAGWRGDAERALAVVKEYLTPSPPPASASSARMKSIR